MGFETPVSQAEDDIALHNSRQVAYEETGSLRLLVLSQIRAGKIYMFVSMNEKHFDQG